ncbi:ABC transporter ATP-binding protein [Ornatilinea apprima]|uniref:ABC transporter ATP-binding protein n=1 Tax=Ornatilinea apprima TaxID=1134406 RepID=UPI0009467528|nr:ABC transporter ATP-binding protein [Ornatilinea apprima]
MENQSEWVIETQDLTRIYGDGDEIRALDGVSLRIRHGELVSVMGPSGSGKSTLLNVIGALDLPTSGNVFIDGIALSQITNKDDFRAKKVGFVFQLHNLLPTLTARENIEVPMMAHMGPAARKARSEELLTLVGLADRKNHLPGQLSGGQRQRVAIARALANNPPIVLADEPTGSLDTTNGQELMHLLRDLNRTQGTTFVVVTHDLSVARQTNRVIVMKDGRIDREDIIGNPIEEDFKIWRHSVLGKDILEGGENALDLLNITPEELESIRNFLSQHDKQ